MAEPLLKRTFSRLRGKERSRRKTDPKLNELQGKSGNNQFSSSTSPSTTTDPPVLPADDPSPPRTHITVAKKQQWAKQASVGRDPPNSSHSPSLAYRPQDWDSSSGKAQASAQVWSQRLVEDRWERRCPAAGLDCSSPPCDPLTPAPALSDPLLPHGGATELPVSSSNVKLTGQGAYLQSLDRSSRAWVLSTGKPQASEEASRSTSSSQAERRAPHCGAEGDNNIWYNPIPEEEDGPRGGGERMDRDRENVWRRRDPDGQGGEAVGAMDPQTRAQRRAGVVGSLGCGGGGAGGLERHNTQCPPEGGSPGSSHRNHDNAAENLDQLQVEPASAAVGGASDSSPASQKKVGVAGSMIDRIKSPGTVRKLSMKMKKLPELRRKLSLRSSRSRHGNASGAGEGASPSNGRKDPSSSPSNQNVISRYHLDSSAPARPLRRSSRGRSSSASKGGYLSDGDSPELLPRQTPPPALAAPCSTTPGLEGSCDLGAFRPYVGSEQPRCAQRVTGLLTVHLLGLEEMPRPARADATKEVSCAIQVDGVTRARTSLLTCRGPALQLNHTFHLELERARLLRLVVLTPHTPTPAAGGGANQAASNTRNRVCCLGGVSLPPLFKASRAQQLCVRLEPRGLLYVKLTLQEQWQSPSRSSDAAPPSVFGVELRHLVEKEGSAPTPVPLLIQKSVAEIEKRGLKVVGLYRLCGSAAVKKELRDAFERDSSGVSLNEELYPDINVVTGILKDYLRELPSPLITTTLYQVVLDAMATRPPRPLPEGHAHFSQDPLLSQATVALLHCLPQPERATLSILLDHLSLVASYSHCNRMSHQNLAVCFGPVLLTPTQECWQPRAPGGGGVAGGGGGGRGGGGGQGGGKSFSHSEEIASAVDFKRHIEALHYLLQLWPVPTERIPQEDLPLSIHPSIPDSPPSLRTHNALQRRAPLRLALPGEQEVVVSRRGRGRLESPPINRYAGDWSVCGRNFLSGGEGDYDEVAGSESEEEEEEEEGKKEEGWSSVGGVYVDDFGLDFDAPFSCRLSLKDFDTLIHDLEKELAKQINICM